LEEEYGRDVDIVRRRIFRIETPEEFECTLHEEILPPAYRYMPTKLGPGTGFTQPREYN
jgi:small subunit ribosomal protein S6